MKNAEKFRKIFKEFATEVWAFPEKDFLTWLNAEYEEPTTKNDLGVFVPVILTDKKGNKQNAFLYKPQRLIVTSYITEELAKDLGYKIEVEE